MEKEEILRVFRNYISRTIRLTDLEDWLLSHLQAIIHSGDQEAIGMADQVDALLVEIGAGVTSEEELFKRISGLLSEAETVRLTFSLNEAPDITFVSIDQSSNDSAIAAAPVIGFSPHFA